MKQVIQHAEDLWQIKVPLPFPLRWVNSYVLKGDTGFTAVDPGLHTPEAEETWISAMQEIGINDYADMQSIVLTHHHPDHYGMAGWLQERSGAPVRMSEIGRRFALHSWGPERTMSRDMYEMCRMHGMFGEPLEQMIPHMEGFVPLVSPQPQVSCIAPGDRITLGKRDYSCILTPGHAAGHLSFYQEDTMELLCGDQVIPQISSNVSFIPGSDPNPLDSFLNSLQELSRLKVSKAYPGHRDPFTGFQERTFELLQHHEQRLQDIMELLWKPLTAYQVCLGIFGDKLSIHQLRFAISETIAHVVYLEQQGKVSMQFTDGIITCCAV